MPKDFLLLLIFGGFFLAPVALALALGWFAHLRQLRSTTSPPQQRQLRRRAPTTLEELMCMAEFQRRWRRTMNWTWAGWLAAAIAIFALGLPMTAFALATLLPFSALIEHLRCPSCDSTATLRGLTDGRLCRRCGARLKP